VKLQNNMVELDRSVQFNVSAYRMHDYLSGEHPFGTVKWHHDARYLLCRGMEKATGELGLSFLVNNLKRAINLVGVPDLVKAMRC
jgi:hypothetical protein